MCTIIPSDYFGLQRYEYFMKQPKKQGRHVPIMAKN